MKVWSAFLLIVGSMWLLCDVWLLLALARITEPISPGRMLLYWGPMFIGPLTLIVGASLLLRGGSLKLGTVLAVTGSLFFTAVVLYNSFIGMCRLPLQMPPPYPFYVALLGVMVLTNVAAYKISRLLASTPAMRE
jgi:hypothetical protein